MLNLDSWKRLTLASALLATLGIACSTTVDSAFERAGVTSEATLAVKPTCPIPYTAVCDATGASCRCEIDPETSPALAVKDIAAASRSTYVINPDGTVSGWGAADEDSGFPLGPIVPGTDDTRFPSAVTTPQSLGVANAVQLAAGPQGACALLADGTVSCWGTLYYGAPSQTPTLAKTTPTPGHPSVNVANAASITRGTAHVCALLNDASVVCWGDNRFGQLGNGTAGDQEDTASPLKTWPITSSLIATQVVAAGNTTCVRYSSGQVFCFGENTSGQLGLGSHGDLTTAAPQPVQGLGKADAIYGGGLGTFCAHQPATATAAEITSCWGDDVNNELDGVDPAHDAYSPHEHPVKIAGMAVRAFSSFNGCAWPTDGAPTCWGLNTYGLLGAGTSVAPRVMPSLTKVVQIAMGDSHVCVVDRHGVSCWGNNEVGQLGIGTTAPVSGVQPVSAIEPTICNYGSHLVTCTATGGGLNGDGCACPICVPKTQDQGCPGVTCGLIPHGNGCGGTMFCPPCPRLCPKGAIYCGTKWGCILSPTCPGASNGPIDLPGRNL